MSGVLRRLNETQQVVQPRSISICRDCFRPVAIEIELPWLFSNCRYRNWTAAIDNELPRSYHIDPPRLFSILSNNSANNMLLVVTPESVFTPPAPDSSNTNKSSSIFLFFYKLYKAVRVICVSYRCRDECSFFSLWKKLSEFNKLLVFFTWV